MILSTPPGDVMSSDDEEEWDVENGQDAPMTPQEEDLSDMYSPASPRTAYSEPTRVAA